MDVTWAKLAAWDVLNEPMNENGTLRIGTEDLTSGSVFPWALYLGKDYGVTAFKTALAADPDAKLFVNDYGLESSGGAKVDGLYGSDISAEWTYGDKVGGQ